MSERHRLPDEQDAGAGPAGDGAPVGLLARVKAGPAGLLGRVNRLYDDARARPVHGVRVLGVAVLAVAVLTGALYWGSTRYAGTVTAREQAMDAARHSVVQVLSYNFRSIDDQLPETEGLLTGQFKQDYDQLMRNTLIPGAKVQLAAIQSAVVSDSVVSSGPNQAVLLMFINQQSENRASSDPVPSTTQVRVTMDREQGKWLISELKPV